MEPSKQKSKSGGSAAERELVARSPACENTEISPESAKVDDDKEFQGIMSIVTDLKRELEHSWKLREALQEEVAGLRTRQDAAETLATARSREIGRIEKDISSLRSETEQLTADLAASEEERSEAVKEINRLKADLEDKKQELQRLNENISSLKNTLDATKRGVESSKQESQQKIDQLRQDTEKLEKRLKQKIQELSQEVASIDDLKREKGQLASEVAHLMKTRANLKKIHDSLKSVQQMCSFSEPASRQPKEEGSQES